MSNVAVYPGSFDPFTNGHFDIVKKSSKLFDLVYIVIGVNSLKRRTYKPELIKTAIEQVLEASDITNCKVIIYNGLIGKFTQENNIGYMVRGLRNNMDYNELELAFRGLVGKDDEVKSMANGSQLQ